MTPVTSRAQAERVARANAYAFRRPYSVHDDGNGGVRVRAGRGGVYTADPEPTGVSTSARKDEPAEPESAFAEIPKAT